VHGGAMLFTSCWPGSKKPGGARAPVPTTRAHLQFLNFLYKAPPAKGSTL
jgi:hypothetical protein